MHERVLLSDNELILKAQQGDKEAFEQLVHRHDKRVMAIALTHTHDEDDAKDIYQDAFLRLYRALPGFSFRSEFSTWMYRIVTNVCLTFHSRWKKYEHVSLDALQEQNGEHQPGSALQASDEISLNRQHSTFDIAMHIQKSIDVLSPSQRMVFTLKHFHGYKIREIAVLMNCAEGTVKKHLFTAIERLRKQLKDFS